MNHLEAMQLRLAKYTAAKAASPKPERRGGPRIIEPHRAPLENFAPFTVSHWYDTSSPPGPHRALLVAYIRSAASLQELLTALTSKALTIEEARSTLSSEGIYLRS